jgi:hypothetical protein
MRIPLWRNITVEKYQYINEIGKTEMSEIDKLLFTITFLTGKTEDQINLISLKTYQKLEKQVRLRFLNIKGKPYNSFKGFRFNYDFKKITLGQYIEVQHFLKGGHIETMHIIAASITTKGKLDHVTRGEQILKLPFLPVLHSMAKFLEQFKEFNDKYKGLFGVSEDGEQEDKADNDDFNNRYGWIYSAKKVAEFEGITLEKAFDLPVIQSFNDLAYLKSLSQYESELAKRQRDAIH